MKLVAMYEMHRARLLMTGSLVMILVLFGLDLRDLYYKLHMLGPYDSHSFLTVGYDMIQSKPIPRPNTTIEMLRNGSASAASGWPSFYSRCETMYASGTEDSRFFLTTVSHNCTINTSTNVTRVVPQILMTASIRVDSVVAVSCLLLFTGRRPAICQESIAIGFNERYMLEEMTPTFEEMAQPGSDEEDELLRLLHVVSYSYPHSLVTCAEGVVLAPGEVGVFRSTVFGCASPNMFQSEWIGFVHKPVGRFLVNKGWLTADVVSFMGIRYGIRQNSIDVYDVSYKKDTGTMALTSSAICNFSSYGHLYAISVLIDILLLIAHFLSTFEVLKWILLPQYLELQDWMREFEETSQDKITAPKSLQNRGFLQKIKSALGQTDSKTDLNTKSGGAKYSPAPESSDKKKPLVHAATDGGSVVFEEVQFYSFFSRSFYRNNHYVLLTTITQVLSWIIILPNSVVWTWSDSVTQKLQGYLCSLKSWVLIASALNFAWSVIVKLDEKRAYKFVRGTYITNPEIIGVGALVAMAKSTGIFSMSGTKYTYEHQRFYDFSSFLDGYLGYGNSYERSQDYVTTTSLHVAWIIYKPLVEIVFLSLLACGGYLMLKFAFLYFMEREGRDVLNRMLGRPARPRGSAIHVANSNDGTAAGANRDHGPVPYARLPLEEALGCPIRAVSLVRNTLSMEIVKDGKTYIRPSCYLDFGVMLKNGHVETRVGFSDIFKSNLPIKEALPTEQPQHTHHTSDQELHSKPPASTVLAKAMSAASTDGIEHIADHGAGVSLRSIHSAGVTPIKNSPRAGSTRMTATSVNAAMVERVLSPDGHDVAGAAEDDTATTTPP